MRCNMLTASRWILILAGFWLVFDAILIIAGIPNPLFGWPLPCPITLVLLGLGIFLLAISSGAFKNEQRR